LALIQQAAQPLHRRLFGPGEAALLRQQPVDLSLVITPEQRLLRNSLPAVIAL